MLALNSSTFFVADMVIPFGRYGLFVWPMWSWPIWYRPAAHMKKTAAAAAAARGDGH